MNKEASMILTLLSIDNKEFYFMTGSQKPETIARYIRKGKIKAMNEAQKADYIKNMARKNNSLIVREIITQETI